MPAVLDRHRHTQPAARRQRRGEFFVPSRQPRVDGRGECAGGQLIGEEHAYLGAQGGCRLRLRSRPAVPVWAATISSSAIWRCAARARGRGEPAVAWPRPCPASTRVNRYVTPAIGAWPSAMRARGFWRSARPAPAPREQIVVRHHAADQTPLQRGRGVDPVAGESHLGGALVADDPLQEPGAAVAGDEAELHEALCERCSLGGDSDVAHHGQVAAGADGGTVDGSDQRDFESRQRSRDPLDAVDIGVAAGRGRSGRTCPPGRPCL